VLIVSSASGFWSRGQLPVGAAPEWALAPDGAVLLGVALVEWQLTATRDEVSEHRGRMRMLADRMSRGMCLGYLDYTVIEMARLVHPEPVNLVEANASPRGLLRRLAAAAVDGDAQSCSEVVDGWHRSPRMATMSLAPALAAALVMLQWTCMHCVQLTRRTHRSRMVPGNLISKRCMRAFIARASGDPGFQGPNDEMISSRGNWRSRLRAGQLDPQLVLEWVDASAYLRDLRKSFAAASSFARVFAHTGLVEHAKLIAALPIVSSELLRQARIRVDIVAMFVFRRWFASLRKSPDAGRVVIHLYCDASPQWRGLEMFASSFELAFGDTVLRRLFPLVSLDRRRLDALGKTLTLMWQIYLIVGPSADLLKYFCSRVASITTDMGVEHKIANMPGLWGEFWLLFEPSKQLRDGEGDDDWLFPNCLHCPGWNHTFDLVLRTGLCSLAFFPSFLEKFKAVIAFLRLESNVSVLCQHLNQRGVAGVAEMLRAARLPKFAAWRWGTLHEACKGLDRFVVTLSQHFDAAWFAATRQAAQLGLVTRALSSEDWLEQFRFVTWFCQWIGELMIWGRGCDCHEGEDDAECSKKGRRLASAYTTRCSGCAEAWRRPTHGRLTLGAWRVGLGRRSSCKAACEGYSTWLVAGSTSWTRSPTCWLGFTSQVWQLAVWLNGGMPQRPDTTGSRWHSWTLPVGYGVTWTWSRPMGRASPQNSAWRSPTCARSRWTTVSRKAPTQQRRGSTMRPELRRGLGWHRHFACNRTCPTSAPCCPSWLASP